LVHQIYRVENILRLLSTAALVAFTTGCVSSSKYDDAVGERDKLQQTAQAHAEKIQEQEAMIVQLQSRLGTTNTDKEQLQKSVTDMQKALAEMKKRQAEADLRLTEYANLARKFKRLIDAGKLSVKIVDGRMVVALSSDILFASGSDRLSKDGQNAIREVARTLVTLDDKKIQVEGHTDNVPIQTERFPSNWELASGRAISVLRVIREEGMTKERISAASFADNRPVADNSTAEGRKLNRRIEIAIMPDLSSLPGFEELQKFSQ